VDKLDLERKTAYVRKVDVDYYTDAMTYTNVRVIDSFAGRRPGPVVVEHGEVQVVRKVVGFKKIKFYTAENLGYGDVALPEKDMHTTSYWFTIPRDVLLDLPYNQAEIIDGLGGLAYGLHHLAAMRLMADLHDLDRAIGDKSGEWFVKKGKELREIANFKVAAGNGVAGRSAAGGSAGATSVTGAGTRDNRTASGNGYGTAAGNGKAGISGGAGPAGSGEAARLDAYDPTIFIFDAYPGGIGFSELLYAQHEDLLAAVRRLLRSCPCSHGCPSCVGPTLEVGPAAKEVALAILERL
jgi:DEAD/DEAH box helicase domain-containing protein